jgi:hypothetical protein
MHINVTLSADRPEGVINPVDVSTRDGRRSRSLCGYQPPFDELPWKDEGANDNA